MCLHLYQVPLDKKKLTTHELASLICRQEKDLIRGLYKRYKEHTKTKLYQKQQNPSTLYHR